MVANILVVEDDQDLGDLYAELLRSQGHVARVARNGREGLENVAALRPDLILCDVEMPVLDGPDMAYALLLRNAGDDKVPIVLLSGVVGLQPVAARVGTPYFLGKPFTVDRFLDLLDRALAERAPPSRPVS